MSDDAKIRFDANNVTVGDMEDFEEITGKVLDEVFAGAETGKLKLEAKTLKAVVFIAKRHEDPSFTLEQARDVKISEVEVVPLGVDPTEAAS